MTGKVVVADYGAGNLLSVCRALEHCGAQVVLASTPADLRNADRLLVPGVGSFAGCMQGVESRGLADAIREHAASGRPLLGICVGMQMLFETSDEFGEHAGLGLLGGRVKRIPHTGSDGRSHKVPHIGWNALQSVAGRSWQGTLLDGIKPQAAVYFVHSFTASPTDESVRLADADYDGCCISAAVAKDNVHGCQFHPEKSAGIGLAILNNFVRL